ncbi:MAG TPA: hypothetical protein VM166_04820 [Gemmatimonadaceae bacterium]|nr:hypothetical protein [Gemmatimonadaceae bacterium]
MPPTSRSRRAVIALVLTTWSQACVAMRPAPADLSIPTGSRVRVHSTTPFEVTRQTDTLPARTSCCVSSVDGRFLYVAGDTIALERAGNFAPVSDGSRIPGSPEVMKVVRAPGTEVTIRQTDRARTTALILGITAVLLGLAALAASQMELGFPPSDGGFLQPQTP